MIKKIHIIKNLAVYQNFNWNRTPALKDMNEVNIIYGSNYSGKTTLSRIFASLRDRHVHSDYPDCEFKIEMYDGSIIDSIDLQNCNLKVAVFNRDYIEKNLSMSRETKWKPIEFDVGENVEIRERINEVDRDLLRMNEIDKLITQRTSLFDNYENKLFTDEAKNIRILISNGIVPFDKSHFKKIKEEIGRETASVIIEGEDEIRETQAKCIAHNSYTKIEPVTIELKYNDLRKSVVEILEAEPPKDKTIEILDSNIKLYNWAKEGLTYSENTTECAFCGNNVSEQRIKDLNDYFSNASKVLRDRIIAIKEEIQNEIDNTNNLDFHNSKMDYVDSVRSNAEKVIADYRHALSTYHASLRCLLIELDRKEDGMIHKPVQFNDAYVYDATFGNWVIELNTYIEKHNRFVNDFVTIQNNSRILYAKHLVASYLRDEDYYRKLDRYIQLSKKHDDINACKLKQEEKKAQLQNSLKTITLGREKLDTFISRFLGRNDIHIEITHDDKFQLMRRDKPAINLSDGEKTAICFSYFIVSLESMGLKELQDHIVFIDDPISSFDSNHISQIYSFINSFFFRNSIDPNHPETYVNIFKQLFISTHNFDFFSFLKGPGRIKKNNGISLYLIERLDQSTSTIVDLPKELKNYNSEYVYLFSLINKYKTNHDAGNGTPEIMIPNAMRRFLEIYTLIKLPGNTEGVDKRLSLVADGFGELKTLNHLSHFTSLEKITRFDEIIMNLPQACNELYSILKKDSQHYDSLMKAIT
jgi:wobble nucleotide-excising tRNase